MSIISTITGIALIVIIAAGLVMATFVMVDSRLDRLRGRLRSELRREIGGDLQFVPGWVRAGDDPALIVRAVAELLNGGYPLDSRHLRLEYEKLMAVKKVEG